MRRCPKRAKEPLDFAKQCVKHTKKPEKNLWFFGSLAMSLVYARLAKSNVLWQGSWKKAR